MTLRAIVFALPCLTALACAGGGGDDDDEDEDDGDSVASEARQVDLPDAFETFMDGASLREDAVYVWGVYPSCDGGSSWEVTANVSGEAEAVLVFAWDMVGQGDLIWAGLAEETVDEEWTVWADPDDIGTACDGEPVLFGAAARDLDDGVGDPSFTGWFGEDAWEANVIYSYGHVSSGSQAEYLVEVDGDTDGVELYALNPVASTVSRNVQMDDLGDGAYSAEVDTRVLGGANVDSLWVGFMATLGGEAVGLAGT